MVEKKYFLFFGALEKKFCAFCGIEGKFFFLKKGFCLSRGENVAKSEKKSKILVKRFSKTFSKTF
jgi:hypothetical protein